MSAPPAVEIGAIEGSCHSSASRAYLATRSPVRRELAAWQTLPFNQRESGPHEGLGTADRGTSPVGGAVSAAHEIGAIEAVTRHAASRAYLPAVSLTC